MTVADIVNLRQVRKQRARDEKAATAEQNRALHGRSKAERRQADDERDRAARTLDGHRRDDGR